MAASSSPVRVVTVNVPWPMRPERPTPSTERMVSSSGGITMLPCSVRRPSTEYTITGAELLRMAPTNAMSRPLWSVWRNSTRNTRSATAPASRPKRAFALRISFSARNTTGIVTRRRVAS